MFCRWAASKFKQLQKNLRKYFVLHYGAQNLRSFIRRTFKAAEKCSQKTVTLPQTELRKDESRAGIFLDESVKKEATKLITLLTARGSPC